MNMIPCGPTPNSSGEDSKHSAHIVKEENNEEEEEEVNIQQVKATGQIPEIQLLNLNETATSTNMMDQSTKVGAEQSSTNIEVQVMNSSKESPE
jgi:hypothetical protein